MSFIVYHYDQLRSLSVLWRIHRYKSKNVFQPITHHPWHHHQNCHISTMSRYVSCRPLWEDGGGDMHFADDERFKGGQQPLSLSAFGTNFTRCRFNISRNLEYTNIANPSLLMMRKARLDRNT
jgi:hypothetical protein